MNHGICKLCTQYKLLCDSHAIPNSLFNYILRKSDGKAIILINDAKTPNRYSSDTWEVKLLCEDCEQLLNISYDAYGIAVFRGHQGHPERGPSGITFRNIDRKKLRMFFLSVLWRISVSTHSSYSSIDLPVHWEEELRESLLYKKAVPSNKYTVAISRMTDSTVCNGFSNEDLRGLVASPFARDFGSFISVCYLFLGFFVETFLPKVPPKYSKRVGILHGKSLIFLAPYIELLDIPELVGVLGRALEKHDQGLSTFA